MMMLRHNLLHAGVALLTCLLPNQVKAQDYSNYVLTETLISNTQGKIQEYQFYDGLGRESVKAENGFNSYGLFQLTLKEFSGENRLRRTWLPVVGGYTAGTPTKSWFDERYSHQYSDGQTFESYDYDALGRLERQYKAGTPWKDKPATVSYVTNVANDVKYYIIVNKDDATTIIYDNYYDAGKLSGKRETDEDGCSVTTYADVFGKKIMERRGDGNDTYYVYDDLDRLNYVLTPEYQHSMDLDKHAYQYYYDMNGNLLKKKLPGCEPIEYLYDNFDRCVSVQDGEMRKNGLYRFMLYDNMGRLVVQGLSTSKPDNTVNGTVRYSCGSGGIGGTDYEVLANADLKLTIKNIEIINYYDNYTFFDGCSEDS
ncbi:MAG: hypothetical protein IKR18_02810, partial [Bacteroidaceae bacterium]|nr:hypothetical protein [Bacteroidaceae bacterium]